MTQYIFKHLFFFAVAAIEIWLYLQQVGTQRKAKKRKSESGQQTVKPIYFFQHLSLYFVSRENYNIRMKKVVIFSFTSNRRALSERKRQARKEQRRKQRGNSGKKIC